MHATRPSSSEPAPVRSVPLWPAVGSPALLLALQSFNYALLQPMCSREHGAWLHLFPLLALAAVLVATLLAAREMRRLTQRLQAPGVHDDGTLVRRRFTARMGTGIGALTLLSVLALWIPQWLLSPCTQ